MRVVRENCKLIIGRPTISTKIPASIIIPGFEQTTQERSTFNKIWGDDIGIPFFVIHPAPPLKRSFRWGGLGSFLTISLL